MDCLKRFFKILPVILILLIPFLVSAQIVSMTNGEIAKLKKTTKTDSAAGQLFSSFKLLADKSLQETPNPIAKIESQGLLEGNPAKTASLKALIDGDKVYALALTYRLNKDSKYLVKATEYLTAWAKLNKPTGDPINETKLEAMITGYDLIRNTVAPASKVIIDKWLDTIGTGQINSFAAKPGRGTAVNNWNSHRIKIITLVAYTLHSDKYYQVIQDELVKQVNQNLNADGTSWDLMERDAFHYHIYDLEPLTTTAVILKRGTGKDFFNYQSPKGASIKKSVDYMAPFMTGEKTHGEFVNSRVEFDRKRAANHEKGYEAGTLFEPKAGVYLLSSAAYFDPFYISVLEKTKGEAGALNWQLLLSNIKANRR